MVFSGHTARKRFGQHWLKDSSVLEEILRAADLKSEDFVLEVGPGRGALTNLLLASRVSFVQAVEIDRDLVEGLKKRFSNHPRFSVREGNALSVSLKTPEGHSPNKVVANIPYNITGPLLERLLGRLESVNETSYERLVLLLQKEVADRILAIPGDSQFSSLSVRTQLMAKCKSVCLVPPTCFRPPPKVYSKVIVLEPFKGDERIPAQLARCVDQLLRSAFVSRRKMLRNTLGRLFNIDYLDSLSKDIGISLNQRPQELSPSQWVDLAGGLIQLNQKS